MQVLTSGRHAPGTVRFQGGVINATPSRAETRSTGRARVDFTQEAWNETTPRPRGPREDKLNEVYRRRWADTILKDHLWFFVGARTIPTATATTLTQFTGQNFVTTTEEDRWQVKLTGAITPNHIIEAKPPEFDPTTTRRVRGRRRADLSRRSASGRTRGTRRP